jgi:hypothetical protein
MEHVIMEQRNFNVVGQFGMMSVGFMSVDSIPSEAGRYWGIGVQEA